jgi:hypothetical protein
MDEVSAAFDLIGRGYPRARALQGSVLAHRDAVRTDPAILVAALVAWRVRGCTELSQYWQIADTISDRVRGRYRTREEAHHDDEQHARV